jgi:bifunctional DNA-binding transcriptional regulator/antitoxin component of YhaV-PrlF toxin-antitoxin module
MTKITKTGSQYKISIPKEIMILTGWDENTEVILTPYIKEPNERITPDTPIIIKKIPNQL